MTNDNPSPETLLRRKIRKANKNNIVTKTEPLVTIMDKKRLYLTHEAMEMLPDTFGIFYHWKYFAIIEGDIKKAKFIELEDVPIEDGTFALFQQEEFILAKRVNFYKLKRPDKI